jgi:hypothetical protein
MFAPCFFAQPPQCLYLHAVARDADTIVGSANDALLSSADRFAQQNEAIFAREAAALGHASAYSQQHAHTQHQQQQQQPSLVISLNRTTSASLSSARASLHAIAAANGKMPPPSSSGGLTRAHSAPDAAVDAFDNDDEVRCVCVEGEVGSDEVGV